MRLLNLILFSHLFIAFCASCLYLFYRTVLNESIDLIQLVFIFLGTSLAYNIIELFPSHSGTIQTIRGNFIKRHKKFIIALSSLFFIALSFLFFELESDIIKVYVVLFFMVIIYEGNFHKRLAIRKIPYLKSFYIALVWAMAIFAPDLFGAYASFQSIMTFFEAFLFILVLCIAFDLRDHVLDKRVGLKTIVTKFGHQKTFYICGALFILQAGLASFLRPHIYTIAGELLSFTLFIYFLKKVTTDKGDLWCYAGIDGLILLKWLGPLLHYLF